MMDERNVKMVQELSKVLNMMKGFDAAYSNPDKGVMLVRHEGRTYMVEMNPLYNEDSAEADKDFLQVCEENKYLWR